MVFVEVPNTEDRFMLLASGDVDVLSGGNEKLETDVLEPISGEGFAFTQPYFYDSIRFAGIPE